MGHEVRFFSIHSMTTDKILLTTRSFLTIFIKTMWRNSCYDDAAADDDDDDDDDDHNNNNNNNNNNFFNKNKFY